MRTHRHLDLLDIDIKSTLLNMLKEPKEIMEKELEENVSHQIQNISRNYRNEKNRKFGD